MDIESQLRSGLAARAADVDTTPTGLLDDVLVGHRRSVHRRRAALVAVGVAVLVAVAVPVGVNGTSPDVGSGARSAATVAYERYPYEPRGSLVGDPGYVDGLLARDWWPASVGPQPAPETRQVAFAGEVPGGVMALVTGWSDGARLGQWLGGPSGSAPQDLTPIAEPVSVPDDQAASYLWSADGTGALVVVTQPGDVIELSPDQDIAASGDVVRAPFEAVGGADGTAVVDLASLNPATFTVQVSRAGEPVDVGGGTLTQGGDVEPDLGAALAEAAGDPDPDLVRLLVQGILQRTGLSADEVIVGVRWGGPVGSRTQSAEGVMITVQLPSGATVLAVGVGYSQDGVGEFSSTAGLCGQIVLAAGTDVAAQLVAARCDLSSAADGASLGSQVVVVPPDGTAVVQLTGAGGAVIDTRELTGPALVGPAPDGLQGAVALDADGGLLMQAPLLGLEPLQLD